MPTCAVGGIIAAMPKPTVQNTPKPEPQRASRPAKKPAAAPVPRLATRTWDRVEVLGRVLQELEMGASLNKACATARQHPGGCPHPATVLGWTREDPLMGQQYARARETGYNLLADELLDIADEAIPSTEAGSYDSAAVAHQRLRIDTRKWQLSKMLPKVYGDKVLNEHTGANGGPIQTAAVDLRGLSDTDLATMEQLLRKAAPG